MIAIYLGRSSSLRDDRLSLLPYSRIRSSEQGVDQYKTGDNQRQDNEPNDRQEPHCNDNIINSNHLSLPFLYDYDRGSYQPLNQDKAICPYSTLSIL